MLTAGIVADWFLGRNEWEYIIGDAEPITNLKLQKLLYYAQGVYSALTGEFLFEEDFVAWEHGPVIESLYHEYKGYGGNPIPYEQRFFDSTIEKLPEETENILEMVYENFAQFSAWKLRNMTHEERPWRETPRNFVIQKNCIRDFFVESYLEEA